MVTIKQVARRAHVSVATVSRVLNNSPKVRPRTAERVRSAIKELRYTPNQSARNLRRNENRILLVLGPDFSNPYYSRILTGIGDMAREREYSIFICNTAGDAENEKHFLKMLDSRRADGAILLSCHKDYDWLSEWAVRYPIVQCCEYVPELCVPSVSIDNYASAFETVAYLLQLGHRRIAMLGADNLYISTQLRREGYQKAMADAGCAILPGFYSEADANYSFASGREAAKKLLAQDPRPTAIFCVSDMLALSVISVAQEQGLSVPGDLTVTGFDDVDASTMFHPYLTTVAQPCYEMGRHSAAIALALLQEDNEFETDPGFSPHRLVVRESSAPPPV